MGLVAVATTMIALAIGASPASAATTRAEYVAQVDPICQTALTTDKALFGRYVRFVKRYRKRHPNLDSEIPSPKAITQHVARYYEGFAKSERSATSQIALIAPAPGDEATAALWIQARTRLAEQTESGASDNGHR